jgi:hypothetical protein
MLFWVDVAVTAFQIAAGENVKKYIDGIFGKSNSFFHRLIWS